MTAIINPPTTAPPTTVQDVRRLLDAGIKGAFRDFTARTQEARDDQYGMSMSSIGGCSRQAAYRISHTAPSDVGEWPENRAANIGTMIHEGLLPLLADRLGGVEELDVDLVLGGLAISGRTDFFIPGIKLVGDLKTSNPYLFAQLGDTARQSHRFQVGGYAVALLQAGFDVRFIAWTYLDRASGQDHLVIEEITDELLAEIEQRCEDLALYSAQPEAAPRDQRGPGLSIVCDGCPWLRECWGEDAIPGEVGAQKILAHDNEAVAAAIELYDQARAKIKVAEGDREFAKAMFSGYEPGKYGAWEFAWSKAGDAKDKDAAVAALETAGLPVPRKPGAKRLIVKRAKT